MGYSKVIKSQQTIGDVACTRGRKGFVSNKDIYVIFLKDKVTLVVKLTGIAAVVTVVATSNP